MNSINSFILGLLLLGLTGCENWGVNNEENKSDTLSIAIDSLAVTDSIQVIDPSTYYLNDDNERIFTMPEKPAEFPGGNEALYSFIQEEIVYPEKSAASSAEGTVLVSFIIDEAGSVTKVKVEEGLDDELLNAEAARVVRNLPDWKPGMTQGENVKVKYLLPIAFALGT